MSCFLWIILGFKHKQGKAFPYGETKPETYLSTQVCKSTSFFISSSYQNIIHSFIINTNNGNSIALLSSEVYYCHKTQERTFSMYNGALYLKYAGQSLSISFEICSVLLWLLFSIIISTKRRLPVAWSVRLFEKWFTLLLSLFNLVGVC